MARLAIRAAPFDGSRSGRKRRGRAPVSVRVQAARNTELASNRKDRSSGTLRRREAKASRRSIVLSGWPRATAIYCSGGVAGSWSMCLLHAGLVLGLDLLQLGLLVGSKQLVHLVVNAGLGDVIGPGSAPSGGQGLDLGLIEGPSTYWRSC